MIEDSKIIIERLNVSISQAVAYASECTDDNTRRYVLSVVSLTKHERDKLLAMIQIGDPKKVGWALRSVSDMTKGLIDIGSDWRERRPDEWKYLIDTAMQAHNTELQNRQ